MYSFSNSPFTGLLVTRQVEDWQEEDKSKEEYAEPSIRRDAELRAAAHLAVHADTVAERVARGHVRPERLPRRGDAAAGRRRVRRPRAHVVQAAREGTSTDYQSCTNGTPQQDIRLKVWSSPTTKYR